MQASQTPVDQKSVPMSSQLVMQAIGDEKSKPAKTATVVSSGVYDLTLLTAFNPALSYGFEPEAATKPQDAGSTDYLLHAYGQYKDVFDAYLYLQNVFSPFVKKVGISQIKPEALLEHLHQLHRRFSRTLAIEAGCTHFAGAYCDLPLFRWQQRADFYYEMIDPLLKLKLKPGDIDKVASKLIVEVNDPKIKENDARQFLSTLFRLQNDYSIPLPDRWIPAACNDKQDSYLTICRLFFQFHAGKLSQQEIVSIQKFVKFAAMPSEIPAKMHAYAKNVLKKWSECNPNDLDQVSELAQFAFYHLTEIHPYFNCNGREATGFVNGILHSFNLPSILMRYPDERDDSQSSYSKAIEHIDQNPQLLIKHIKDRIICEQKQAFTNPILATIIMKRAELAGVILTIKQLHPAYPIDATYERLTEEKNRRLFAEGVIGKLSRFSPKEKNDFIISQLEASINRFSNVLIELDSNIKPGNQRFLSMAYSSIFSNSPGYVRLLPREIQQQVSDVKHTVFGLK